MDIVGKIVSWAIPTACTALLGCLVFFIRRGVKQTIKETILDSIKTIQEDSANWRKNTTEKIEKIIKENTLQSLALQDILKYNLDKKFDECCKKGHTTSEDIEFFETTYKKYHNLGANGVMDVKKQKFSELPCKNEE